MEKTGIVSQFRKWYNPFPVKYFTKQIDRELKLLSEKINSTFGDNEKMKF